MRQVCRLLHVGYFDHFRLGGNGKYWSWYEHLVWVGSERWSSIALSCGGVHGKFIRISYMRLVRGSVSAGL